MCRQAPCIPHLLPCYGLARRIHMRLVAKLLITPRADAVWNGMVVLAGEAGGVIAADVAAVAPDPEPVDGRLYPPD